ncbi:MAG: heme exporter protein CcmD [Pseudomonadota bacterium]|nr:heme exporter protein CcmD [Pseudomonadota bacterium]
MSPAFASVSEFLQMGGAHAPFVWSAWGITVLFLIVLVWQARMSRRRFFREEWARQRRAKVREESKP